MGIWGELVAVAIAIVIGVITLMKYRFKFWERLGIPYIPPKLPFGNAADFLKKKVSFGEQFEIFYNYFKSRKERHGGSFMATQPFYIPVDITIVKTILQNDFAYFMNHGNYLDEENDPLSGHLFNLENAKWKTMRNKLSPTFTSGKLKQMFQTLADCTHGLKTVIDDSIQVKEPLDIKDILARFTTDIIGSVAFGIECNSLKNPNAEFREFGKKIFAATTENNLRGFAATSLPFWLLRLIKFKQFQSDANDFFMNAVKNVVDYREKNNIHRKDFMHLLLQLKNRGLVAEDNKIKGDDNGINKITLNELSAQAFVFFLAGFETSSTTMTFACFEIASNSDIQNKMREEINTVLAKYNNEMTYDAMMEMTYMDNVINETLRKYPPVSVLTRQCNKDWTIPGTDIVLKNGTHVAISAQAIHKDPEYYPDPEKFDPDRFTEENKRKRPACTWLPFGEGPRLCIGLRFGMMQTKVGLTTLLQNYEISLNKKTQLPLQIDKASFITTAEGGIWLNATKIK